MIIIGSSRLYNCPLRYKKTKYIEMLKLKYLMQRFALLFHEDRIEKLGKNIFLNMNIFLSLFIKVTYGFAWD